MLFSSRWVYAQATTRELKGLSPRAANRSVQRDLLSVLEPIKQIRSGMFVQVHGVWLATRPFGTEFDGVCQRDLMTLWYAPTDTADRAEDAPLRPYSLTATPSFHIAALPSRRLTKPRGDHVWQTKCTTLGKDVYNWFHAKDAETAVRGAAVLEAAVKAIKKGMLKAQPCPDIIDRKAGCEAAILAFGRVEEINDIEPCPAVAPLQCYVIDLASQSKLTIEAQFADDAAEPSAVTAISVEEYIIVT
ncbi:hypothetical protein GCM10008023_24440 [Sphingomonas glacialis]|uniref:Uncharacterized protein n=1 Tax=Sphingomonas glacialis TaxID=658225 RepID=A0ABQ3LKN7_9SPHN|nr:hypothetical protein GCM10008023_24440 [Sphingomonas glacialis]